MGSNPLFLLILCFYQTGLSSEQKSNHLESNVVKDTGYLGDIDTSSNESCESVSSESEDNIPLATVPWDHVPPGTL